MSKLGKAVDMSWTTIVFILSGLSILPFAFLLTSGWIQNERFFVVYGTLGALSVLFMFFALLVNGLRKVNGVDVRSSLFIADSGTGRFLSNTASMIGAWIVVTVLVVLSTSVLGSSFGVPNPFSSDVLSTSVLDSHPVVRNLVLVAYYPGLFEEAMVFFFVCLLVLAGRQLAKRFFGRDASNNPGLLLVLFFVSVTIGAALFTAAHATVYGLNEKALVSAFVFSWMVQMANQLTGFFFSFVPHMLHNGIVVFKMQTVFAFGGTVAAFLGTPLLWARDCVKAFFLDVRRVFV